MLGLPKSTEFNKRLPKQKFYVNLTITPALKNRFVEDIRVIYWRNKIAASTMNLAAGQNVTEIEVFEICLSTQTVNEAILRQIDREISYHICSYWNMAAGIRHGSDIRKQRLEIMLSRSSVTITQIGWQRRSFR